MIVPQSSHGLLASHVPYDEGDDEEALLAAAIPAPPWPNSATEPAHLRPWMHSFEDVT